MKRLKRSLSLLSAAVLLAALLPRAAAPAFAADVVDTNKYTVKLSYDDNIQINYQHREGVAIDDWWRGNGDIPLGGASLGGAAGAIPQLYCVDAAVPFHSRVSAMGGASAWQGGKSTDTVPNYVVASPETLPDKLKTHWNELAWLAVNGYSDSASLTAMRTRYSNLADNTGSLKDFDYDVAVMATKVAVWHFTNPDVAYFSTNFFAKSIMEANKTKKPPQDTPSGVKHRQFVALAKRLVEDATAYAANPAGTPLNLPQMELAIENNTILNTVVDGITYRGPYKIVGNGALTSDDLVFLEMDGPEGSGFAPIGFYTKNQDDSFAPIPGDLQKYGGNYKGPGIRTGQEFYIGVPAGVSLDGLSMTALARATTKATTETPVVLVHQNPATGAQDWKAVQAFIGLANAGVEITVYGQAVLPMSSDTGEIKIYKVVYDTALHNAEFSFKLTDDKGNPVDLARSLPTSLNLTIVNPSEGIFRLQAAGGGSQITGLPLGEYKLTELVGADFSVEYRITGGGSTTTSQGITALLTLPTDGSSVTVECINTPIPPSPPIPPIPPPQPTPPAPAPQPPVPAGNPTPPAILLAKYSSDNGRFLEGAEFTLKNSNETYIATGTTNAHGIIAFPALPIPNANSVATYSLTETRAPGAHAMLSGSVEFSVSNYGPIYINPQPGTGTVAFTAHNDTYDGAAYCVFSIMNQYTPPPTPPPSSPGGPTPPEPTPPAPTPESPEPPGENPPPGTPQEVTPPPKLPQTGGTVGFGASPLGVLALSLAGAALILFPALRARRKESGR
ncbi:MAG: Cys-Gln thioester bond-forming surface protein [Clostridiales Family XIII bacterium]|nr:Cys-Gln thioester bond-forming surface protein [Clostridiales Family XIII bacterium]